MTLTTCPVGATLVLVLGLRPSQYCGAFGSSQYTYRIKQHIKCIEIIQDIIVNGQIIQNQIFSSKLYTHLNKQYQII